jgi:hypothetical protein
MRLRKWENIFDTLSGLAAAYVPIVKRKAGPWLANLLAYRYLTIGPSRIPRAEQFWEAFKK